MKQCSCSKPLGKWNKSGLCWRCSNANRAQPIPNDFELWARVETNPHLAERYQVSVDTLTRWRDEVGVPSPFGYNRGRAAANRRGVPDDFAKLAPTMSKAALGRRFGASWQTIDRWCKECGVSAGSEMHKTPLATPRAFETKVIAHREMTAAGQAANFLQRWAPVYRADARGRPVPDGFFWRFGQVVLDDQGIVDRAARKGWSRAC